MAESSKKRLGEILIEDGVLSKANLDEALDQQKKSGGLIGQILIKLGYISEEALVAAVARQMKVPYLQIGNYSVNVDAARLLSEEVSRKNQMLIFDKNEKYFFLCMGDPMNDLGIMEAHKNAGLKPQIFISTPTEVMSMIDVVFGSSSSKPQIKKAG